MRLEIHGEKGDSDDFPYVYRVRSELGNWSYWSPLHVGWFTGETMKRGVEIRPLVEVEIQRAKGASDALQDQR